MEIRDPIHNTIELSEAEVQVIDSAAFQRLRAIKQLGFAEFSFPGATHNRYIHSIGVCHLAGIAFDSIFKDFPFSSSKTRNRLRQAVRLGALLHDIGHGPLSHTTEEVMPKLKNLNLDIYEKRRSDIAIDPELNRPERKANHEDYTIKMLVDSSLTEIIKSNFSDITPFHIACLVDKTLQEQDDFFIDCGLNFRTILSQIVSSELDADRMDYLVRDAYFCGTNYGKVELSWLLSNMTYHKKQDHLHLAINRRALYTFDDFLLSRHHMHLMVYFHHKSIIYEEMLMRYLTSKDCGFFLPSDVHHYLMYTDYALYEHLAKSQNTWAKRITERRPFKMLFELHSTKANPRPEVMKSTLEKNGIEVILANSTMRLSKYHSSAAEEKFFQIYVVDQYDKIEPPYPIEESTEIFQKYEEIRRIERLYVAPENYKQAEDIIYSKKL